MNNFIEMYFKIPEIVRYTITIIINSLISYLVFIALFLGMMFRDYPYFSLALNFVVYVSLSYCTMRLFVFNTKRKLLPEYIKTVIVFVGATLLGMMISLFFKDNPIGIAINFIIIYVYTYITLKWYAFNSHIGFFGRK